MENIMDKNQVSEYISDVNRLLEDFFFKPLISTAMERFGVNNAREIRYFLRDAQIYIDDKLFMEDGVAELASFCLQLQQAVLPKIDDALLVSPFQNEQISMAEDEYLYRKMMCHVFKDNLTLLDQLVEKLFHFYPNGSCRHLVRPESGVSYRDLLLVNG
jgi:hypothetical protein